MKTKYIVIKQHYEDIERVRVFSDFKHLREYICATLQTDLEMMLKLQIQVPQSDRYKAIIVSTKKELVQWTNAINLHAISTEPNKYIYTKAGEIYACDENRDTDLQIGGIIDDK